MEKNNYEDLLPVKVLKVMFVLLFQKQKKQTNEPLDTGKLLNQECTIYCHSSQATHRKGRTIRKVRGGGEFSSRRNFFCYQIPCMKFFFRPWHEYFLGLIGLHEFFSFNFPLREYFFCT